MAVSDEVKKKYDFLLQPIKDLTKNWEIDVSHVLEEYMEELEKMSFSFDNGKTVLNFAEASLLIQGTACVWSRKVEYLYVLVKQTLDMITNKQKEAAEKNMANTGVSNIEDPNFDEDEEKLLKLDDVAITSKREFKANYDPIAPIPVIPAAMLENDSDNRGRAILRDNKNDSVCYTNDFWENRFIPFENMMSVLDNDSGGILDDIIVPSLEDLEIAPMNVFSQSVSIGKPTSPSDDCVNSDGAMEESMDAGGGCDDEMLFVENMEKDKTIVEKMQLRSRLPAVKPVVLDIQALQIPSILDPHEVCVIPPFITKKYEKLNSYRIPASILKKTRKRKLNSSPLKKVEAVSVFMMNRQEFKKKKEVFDGDKCFARFAETENKDRALLWKRIKKESSSKVDDQFLGLPGNDMGKDDVFEEEEFEPNTHNISMHSDGCSPDLDDLIGDIADNQGQEVETDAQSVVGSPTSYEDLVRHHVDMFYSAARRFKEETALSQRVKLWEDAITPRLAEQDSRPEFDIHKYGSTMLNKFENPNDSKLFEDIVQSCDTWYISRLFAATLQLVNDNNFQISKHENFQKSVNTMKLTLLSQHRLCERFDEYTAQS